MPPPERTKPVLTVVGTCDRISLYCSFFVNALQVKLNRLPGPTFMRASLRADLRYGPKIFFDVTAPAAFERPDVDRCGTFPSRGNPRVQSAATSPSWTAERNARRARQLSKMFARQGARAESVVVAPVAH